MIDSRIAQTDHYLKRCVQEDERARALCEQPWVSGAREAIAGLLGTFLDSLDGDTTRITERLREFSQLHTHMLDELDMPEQSKRAIYAVLHKPMHHDADGGEAHIVGLALGDSLLARARFATDIVPAALIVKNDYLLVIGFTEATRSALASVDHPLWIALESVIDYENQLHEDPRNRHHKLRMDVLKGWQQETDILELWHSHVWSMSHLRREVLPILMAARIADPKRFLQMAEKLVFPTTASDMLYTYDIRYDFEHLLVLLKCAPCVLDDEGRWNRNIMAPLLLEVAFGLLRHLGDPPGSAEPLAGLDEIRSKVRSIVLVLLARADGQYLCVNWLIYLLKPLRGAYGSEYVDTLIDECVVQLTSNGFPAMTLIPAPIQPLKMGLQDLQLITLADEEGERAYFEFLIALMLHSKVPVETDLREAFESLLVSARYQFGSSTQYKHCWQHALVALLYIDGKEPVAARWKVAFDRFASMLRRDRLSLPVRDLGVPSLFLAGVGIALIRAGTRPDSPPALAEQTPQLWSEVFEAAFHAYVCSDSFETWAAVIEDLFQCYPAMLSSQAGEGSIALLTYIERLGGDDRLLTQAVAALGLSGLDLCEITEDESLQAELGDRITTYLAWSSQFESRQLPAHVRSYWHNRHHRRVS